MTDENNEDSENGKNIMQQPSEETTEDQEDTEPEGTMEFDFEEDLFVTRKSKEHMMRFQKWESRHKHPRAGELKLDLMLPSKETLMELHAADEDIQKLVQGTSTCNQFYRREGLIFRRWTPQNTNKKINQLILQEPC